MKQLNYFTVLLVCIGLFSCADRKSTENVTTKTGAVPEKKHRRDTSAQHISVAPAGTKADTTRREVTKDSLEVQTKRPALSEDTLVSRIEVKDAVQLFAPVPAGLQDQIVEHELPTTAAIGIRPYPNAYIIKLNPKTEYKGKTYITMELASPDTPDQVLEYYQKWKEDWFYMGGAGVYTFKKDKDKYFRETNTLQILAFRPDFYEEINELLTFKPQTLIRIYYETK